MESSRDSSVWRSLAVAFGDGVAFGVGMKLTQNAGRPAGAPGNSEPGPLAGRIEDIEQRIARMERARAVPVPTGPAAFDHKVLEAVANSLDARLLEHAGKVERRLSELEARVAIEVESLHQRDRSIASGAQAAVEDACASFKEEAGALRARVERDFAALRDHVVSLNQEFAGAVARIVEAEVASAVEARAAELERELAPLRQEIGRDRAEISRLREQVSGSDRAMLDLVLAIGQVCHRAAGRIPGSAPPAGDIDGPAQGEAAAPSTPESAVPETPPAPAAPTTDDDRLPGFAQTRKAARLFEIPLVSSILLATGGLLLLHYW